MNYRDREGMEPEKPVLVEITPAELAAAYREVIRRAHSRFFQTERRPEGIRFRCMGGLIIPPPPRTEE